MEDTLGPPFTRILREVLDPLTPDPVLLGVLRAVSDENLRARELVPLIETDEGYRRYLFAQTFLSERMKEWLSENQGSPDRNRILLERTLGLLGKTPVRNLIACARIERLLGELEPSGPAKSADPAGPEGEDEKITVVPSKLIPFALESERLCADQGWMAPGAAFAAGFHYDCLAALAKKRSAPPDQRSAIEAAFKEGLQIGKAAYHLGQRAREIPRGERAFSTGLLAPIGKAVMAWLFPKGGSGSSWPEFVKSCESASDRAPELALLREPRSFPVTHWEIGSLIAMFGVAHADLEMAICFYPDPERLRRSAKDSYPLCSLLSVAVRQSGVGARRLEAFHSRWLRESGAG